VKIPAIWRRKLFLIKCITVSDILIVFRILDVSGMFKNGKTKRKTIKSRQFENEITFLKRLMTDFVIVISVNFLLL
jgi:hypothetical protein